MTRIEELEKRMSKSRIIKAKDGYPQCKFCKEHPDDCFCADNSKFELKGFKEGKKETLLEVEKLFQEEWTQEIFNVDRFKSKLKELKT